MLTVTELLEAGCKQTFSPHTQNQHSCISFTAKLQHGIVKVSNLHLPLSLCFQKDLKHVCHISQQCPCILIASPNISPYSVQYWLRAQTISVCALLQTLYRLIITKSPATPGITIKFLYYFRHNNLAVGDRKIVMKYHAVALSTSQKADQY